jgi:hypothetical protein
LTSSCALQQFLWQRLSAVSLKSIGLLLGTINEFWNASKKSTLIICGNKVSAVKGLEIEVLGNNLADDGKSRVGVDWPE